MTKTFSAKPGEVPRQWWVVDVEDMVLGRAATQIAMILRGKNKPEYTPHVDTGDFVVVINADKIKVTGAKLAQKFYYQYSGYQGGLKSISLEKLLEKKPEMVLKTAVKGMLPRNSLSRQQLGKLKIYASPDHPHEAQQPKKLDLLK